jgi:hypothetical protein
MTVTPYIEETSVADAGRGRKGTWYRLFDKASGVTSSAFTFAWVYVTLFLSFRIVMAATAAHFGVEPVITLSRLVYQRGDLWYPDAVKHTYLVGTVFMGFSVVFLMAIYSLSSLSSRLFRLTLIWGIVIAAAMVVQRLIGVVLTDMFEFSELARLGMDLGVYATYVRLTMGERGALAALGVLMGILVGMLLAKPLMQTAFSASHVRAGRRTWPFLGQQVFIPSALGLAFAALATYPASLLNHIMCLTALVIIASGMVLGKRMVGGIRIQRQKGMDRWPAIPMLIFIVTVMVVRLKFSNGIAL